MEPLTNLRANDGPSSSNGPPGELERCAPKSYVFVQINSEVAARLYQLRFVLGMIVRHSKVGLTVGATIGVLMDLLDAVRATKVQDAKSGLLLGSEEWLQQEAKKYPWRGRPPKNQAPYAAKHVRALERDEHGAVFSYGHRWCMATVPAAPDMKPIDFCTKCGRERYYRGMPMTKECAYALEPDTFIADGLAHSYVSSGHLEWTVPQPHYESLRASNANDGANRLTDASGEDQGSAMGDDKVRGGGVERSERDG